MTAGGVTSGMEPNTNCEASKASLSELDNTLGSGYSPCWSYGLNAPASKPKLGAEDTEDWKPEEKLPKAGWELNALVTGALAPIVLCGEFVLAKLLFVSVFCCRELPSNEVFGLGCGWPNGELLALG